MAVSRARAERAKAKTKFEGAVRAARGRDPRGDSKVVVLAMAQVLLLLLVERLEIHRNVLGLRLEMRCEVF